MRGSCNLDLELAPLLGAARNALLTPAHKEASSDQLGDLIIRGEGGLSDKAALLAVLTADRVRNVLRESDVHAEQVEKADVTLRVVRVQANSEVVGAGFAAELLIQTKALLFRSASDAVGSIKVEGVGAQVASAPHHVVGLVDLIHIGKVMKRESS